MKNRIRFVRFFIILLILTQALRVQSQVIIGNKADGTLPDSPATTICVSRYQCAQNMIADKMFAYIEKSGTGKIKLAIYADDNENPGKLLMGTHELTNPGTGWISFDLTSGLALTSGTWYYLALWTDNTGYSIYCTVGGGTPYLKGMAYGPWPDPLGPSSPWLGGVYCMYAQGVAGCLDPSITVQPQSLDHVVGTSAIFGVTANGTNLTYQWKKGGVDIVGAILSSYTISSAASGDAGDYTVVISGECGTPVTSNIATLSFCNSPVGITVQPQSIKRNIGTTVTFSVVATGASLTYQWKKGGTDISGATLSSYTINSVNIGDGGDYTVIVSGTCGSPVTSSIANLSINSGDYIIQGQSFNNTDEVWIGVNIERSTKKAFYFLNNSVTSKNTLGYLLQAGDESRLPTNNMLDGEVITGNKFTWEGPAQAQYITHGIFTGCNINAVIKYNYCLNVPMSIIRKAGSDMTNTSGGVGYNVINNPTAVGVVVKGMKGVNIYNNTFYSKEVMYTVPTVPGTWRGLIEVYNNTDVAPSVTASGTKIKNNIFYTKNQIYNIAIYQTECLQGFESDNNVFYCESGTPIFNYLGATKTFAQWQALGYDKHSVVLNPNFISNTLIPSVPLDYGTDLGDEWKQGLSPGAEWGTSAPALASQDSTWQCGAYIVSSAPAADYYVAPYGNDQNLGDITHPFATLNKAWGKVKSGNLVYLRGGTYVFKAQQVLSYKKGMADAIIKIWNYPGEKPILTKDSNYNADFGIDFRENSYVYLKGFAITGFTQKLTGGNFHGLWVRNCNNCTFEQLNYHHNGFPFSISGESTNNLVLNCDFHHDYDPFTVGDPYGNGDGTDCPTNAGTINTFSGCRSWNNSDDGYDFWAANGLWIIENCWAWNMGYREDGITKGGDGNGIKLGITDSYLTTHLRIVTNCLSFHNRRSGFHQNGALCAINLYNNTSFSNRNSGFDFSYNDIVVTARNNISYKDGSGTKFTYESIVDHNTWNGSATVTDADFLSVDTTGVSGPRQADGSLPDLNFMKLATTSKLTNAGVDVGLPFNGAAPDLGAFETGTTTGSTSIENMDGDIFVYPNPVKNILTISSKNNVKEMTLKLYDINGIELFSSAKNGNCTLDLSNYNQGVYFLQIICEGKVTINKILKY